MTNGTFDSVGYTPDWLEITEHPDNGFVFKDQIIPCFDKCVKTVLSLHKKAPFTQIIGWDLIVDKNDSVKIIEWNGWHGDIKFTEATQGPNFIGFGYENLWKQ